MGLPDKIIQIVCDMRRQALVEADHECLRALGIASLKHRMKVRDRQCVNFFVPISTVEFMLTEIALESTFHSSEV